MTKKIFILFYLSFSVFVINAQCMSGTYTIGGASPDYANFTSAVNALTTNSVCGAVTFNVRAGTYTEQITIPQITGTSYTNKVTFQSETGDSSSVVLNFPTSASNVNDYVILFNNADHIHFKNITIYRTGTLQHSVVIQLESICDSILFRRNVIKNNPSSGGSGSPLVYTNGPAGFTGLTFVGNIFENGSSGINIIGNLTSGVVVDSNYFSGQYFYGVTISTVNGVSVKHNSITENNSTTNYGIWLNYCDGNNDIESNKVFGAFMNPIYLSNCNVPVSNTFLIANNFTSGNGGINLYNSNNAKILFNSSYSNGATNSPYSQDGGTNILIKSNIFYNDSNSFAFKITNVSGVPTFASDRNAFYTHGSNVVSDVGTSYTSIPMWTSASGMDSNSVFANVTFVSPTSDLHVSYDNLLYGRAIWNSLVPKDIDGDIRNGLGCCIGADEFPLPLSDASIHSIDNLATVPCTGIQPVIVTLYNGSSSVLVSATINWSVNNIIQPTYSWSGFLFSSVNMAPNINIGNYNFSQNTTYYIKVWTSNLNTGPDLFPANDTAYFTFAPNGMTGIYTIGGSSPDYNTLFDAYADVHTRGVCSPIIFNIRPGTYFFLSNLNHINGSSSVNTITFRAENGDSSSVIINQSIQIDGGDNYIFKQLSIYDVNLVHYSQHNIFSNCEIGNPNNLNGGITISSNSGNNKILNNNILGQGNAGYSLYIVDCGNIFIKNNQIGTFLNSIALYSPTLSSQDTIQNNNFIGYPAIFADSIEFSANTVNSTSNFASNFQGKLNKIFNNFFYGCVLVEGDNSYFVHNSVYGVSLTTASDYVFNVLDTAIVQNNIFYLPAVTAAMIYLGASNDVYSFQNTDYNIYYPSGNNFFYNASNHSFINWQTYSGYDQHSMLANPSFISPTNLHILNPGVNIPSLPVFPFVTKDIDGDPRNMGTPSAGADVYSPISGTFDGGMSSIVMGNHICYGSQPIKIKVYNSENSISLTHALIKWKVNNINQPDFIWSGIVSPHDTSSIFSIGNYFFNGSGTNTVKIWITQPNGFTDPNHTNDTLTTSSFVHNPVDLGNDTTICQGTSIILNAGNFVSYLWSTGSTMQAITVATAGYYSVATTDTNACVYIDTVHIIIPIVNFGNDTSICNGNTILLDATSDFTSYLWSTGATTQTITANSGSTYWAIGYSTNSCISSDTIIVGSYPLPLFSLGNDTTICANIPITLSPGNGFSSYLWSDGTIASTYSAFGGRFGIPNSICASVTNNYGCSSSDTVNIYAKTVNATITCNGNGATLDAGVGYSVYMWTGNLSGIYNTQIAFVTTPEIYTINAVDASGCEALSQYNLNTFSPSSSFTFSRIGLTANFVYPTNGLVYIWNFGDGDTSSVQNPSHTYSSSGSYVVTLTVSNSCGSATSTQNILINSSNIDEIDKTQSINLYPNPNNGIFNIELYSSEKEKYILTVFDITGNKILDINIDPPNEKYYKSINLSAVEDGIYFIKLHSNTKTLNKKIIVIH